MDTEQQKKNAPFSPELIEEILLRLPVKSFVRFRSLSKQYFSLLTDPQFIKSHFDLGAAPTNALLTMQLHSSSKARWVDLDASIRHDHVVRLPEPCDDHLMMIDSCRGFVLLDCDDLVLWNPLTGVHKELSYWSFCLPSTHSFRCGFGYDQSTDDYLVVVRRVIAGVGAPRWDFFSVRTNSWKEFAVTHSPHIISFDKHVYGLFLNGAIHWFAITEHDGIQSKVIIAFDLAEKSISEIPLPDFSEGKLGNLVVVDGYLGVCHHWKGHKVWVMKEYKVRSSWEHYTDAIVPKCNSTTGVRFTPSLLSFPSNFEE